jgi:hypothetical protein
LAAVRESMSNSPFSVPFYHIIGRAKISRWLLIEQKKKIFAYNKYQTPLAKNVFAPYPFLLLQMFKLLFSRPAQQLSGNVSTAQLGKRVIVASAMGVFAYSTVQQCRKDVLFYTSKTN